MEFEAFRVIAQIATALVGFAGIIVALRSRLDDLPPLQLTGFLQTSIGALVFSMLPDLASLLALLSGWSWQVLCGAFGLYQLVIWANFVIRYPDLRRMRPLQGAITIASLPVIGVLMAAGAGAFAGVMAGVYLLGLIWLLAVSLLFFVQVLMIDDGKDRQ